MNLFDMAFNKMLENLHYLDLELMIQAMEAVEEKKDEEIFGKKGTTNWQTKKVLLRCFKKVVNVLSEKIVLSPEEIYEKEFKVDARGYRPQEVDNFLDLIIKDYSEFIKMTRSYEKEITVLNEENAYVLISMKVTNNSITNNDKECFEIIRFQIKSINKLVNDILTLSEIEVAKTDEEKHFKKFNLNSTVEKTISNFSHLPAKINFIQNTISEFLGDEELISTVLSNLLTNAIRYSGSDKIDVILDKQDGQIKLSVKDYGVGIEQKHLEHIFERFYRVDKARSRQNGGSGLGLAIVKNITELHNGTIKVKSTPNKETTFTILFQLSNI